jgi:IS30 family transposase
VTGKLTPSSADSTEGAIVSLTERKSKLTRLAKVQQNTAELVGQVIGARLQSLTVHTITSDNGGEFAQHQRIAQQLKVDFYFAHPYASWERGLNEKTNGLVRQYFPKKSEFSKINDRQIEKVEERLNKRPRKTLGDKTPNEVFFKLPLVSLTT